MTADAATQEPPGDELGIDRELLAAAVAVDENSALEHWHRWSAAVDLDDHSPAAFVMLPDVFRRIERLTPEDPELPRLRGVFRKTWVQQQVEIARLLPVLTALDTAGVDHLLPLRRMVSTLTDRPRAGTDQRIVVRWGDIGRAVAAVESERWHRSAGGPHSDARLPSPRRRITAVDRAFSSPARPDEEGLVVSDHLVPGRIGPVVSDRIWRAASRIGAGSAHCAAVADVAFAVAAEPGPICSVHVALDLAALAGTDIDTDAGCLAIHVGADATREIDQRVERRLEWFSSLGGAPISRIRADDAAAPASDLRERGERVNAQRLRHGGTVAFVRAALGR